MNKGFLAQNKHRIAVRDANISARLNVRGPLADLQHARFAFLGDQRDLELRLVEPEVSQSLGLQRFESLAIQMRKLGRERIDVLGRRLRFQRTADFP